MQNFSRFFFLNRDRIGNQTLNAQGDSAYTYFLEGYLPDGQSLAIDPNLRTFSYLTIVNGRPRFLAQQQFSASELSLLRPLLEHYPQYCPHEVLLANFYNGTVTEQTIARARERLQEAQFAGVWDHEMRPVRNVLSRARFKLKDFGMDVLSILETGYMLLLVQEQGH